LLYDRYSKNMGSFTGTNFEPTRSVGRNRLRVAANGKCRYRIYPLRALMEKTIGLLG